MKINKVVTVLGCSESYIWKDTAYGCKIMINKISPGLAEDKNKLWYFVIISIVPSPNFAYNSNLEHIMFGSKEECVEASKLKAMECMKVNYSREYDNVHC